MPVRKQKMNPEKAINTFFKDITAEEAKELLKKCLEVAITTENEHFETAKERYWIFYFTQRLKELIEALGKSRVK